jgi:2-succinyl-5-enolpyruvyl-6-hydroxy-3-cyclohexene-1-carboxylate synthase
MLVDRHRTSVDSNGWSLQRLATWQLVIVVVNDYGGVTDMALQSAPCL